MSTAIEVRKRLPLVALFAVVAASSALVFGLGAQTAGADEPFVPPAGAPANPGGAGSWALDPAVAATLPTCEEQKAKNLPASVGAGGILWGDDIHCATAAELCAVLSAVPDVDVSVAVEGGSPQGTEADAFMGRLWRKFACSIAAGKVPIAGVNEYRRKHRRGKRHGDQGIGGKRHHSSAQGHGQR